ncbi:MAG TPA: hypothetical protein VGH54_09845 [Mycobacterium sp.]|jgi:hypothetical protein|uniref:hypothetical protein n=1 Tax=Mycobacterium sp. TaxID=1785 RepID=UPI002F3EDBC5
MPETTTSRSIAFWRDWDKRHPYVIATTRTEDAAAPIELIRRYSDDSGDEVLVSLTREEWAELIGFVGEHAGAPVPTGLVCSNCDGDEFFCGACGIRRENV